MSQMTLVFAVIIAGCTLVTVLFSSVAAKLGRLESSQKELDQLLRQEEDTEAAFEAYNKHLAVYNESISRFPGYLIARMYGFRQISADEDDDLL